jgi:hypothetical protein
MNLADWEKSAGGDKVSFKEKLRKIFIVTALIGVSVPTVLINVGENAESVHGPQWLRKLSQPFPSLQASLLCQLWTLFANLSPYNFQLHYLVELTDGRQVLLPDVDRERAGKWDSILFINEPKTVLNLNSDPNAQRRYEEYLIRRNNLDPDTVARRILYMTSQNILTREQSAIAGTHYGPNEISVLDSY